MPHLLDKNHSKLLKDEIKDAEWQVIKRQQLIDYRTHTLARKIYQQLTEPGSLLLAGGIGFIFGELTKRQPSKVRGTADVKERRRSTETSPLKAALNLFTSMQTLYTALPLAWFMKSRRNRQGTTTEAPRPASRPEPTTATAMLDRRKYNRRKPLNTARETLH
ncbi:MAG: hypothetical protein ACXWAT_02250 [Methylobacter sp.]